MAGPAVKGRRPKATKPAAVARAGPAYGRSLKEIGATIQRAETDTILSLTVTFGCIDPLDKSRRLAYSIAPWGDVAEWLRSGLQIRVRQFDSGRRLQALPFILR